MCFSLVPPKITVAPTREAQLNIRSSFVQNYTLRCNASGDPHPHITWTKAGVPASQFNVSGYLLHLVDVQQEDAGSYICTASNGFGDNATAIGIVNIRCKYSKHSVLEAYRNKIIYTNSHDVSKKSILTYFFVAI